ncbi:MAG: hypothetical protein ACRD19_08650 [Terriglobia bacterium]
MADFFNPATLAVSPAAQAIEDRRYPEPRPQAKRKPVMRKPEPVDELQTEEPEDGQPKHALDLDA